LWTPTFDLSKMNISISHKQFSFWVLCALFLASAIGCRPNDAFTYPEPMTEMKSPKVRTYSTDLFISTAFQRLELIDSFEKNKGFNFIDYKVYELEYDQVEGIDFNKIAEHYSVHFKTFNDWEKFDQHDIGFGAEGKLELIGWSKGKNVFLVYSFISSPEDGLATVSTLFSETLHSEVSQ